VDDKLRLSLRFDKDRQVFEFHGERIDQSPEERLHWKQSWDAKRLNQANLSPAAFLVQVIEEAKHQLHVG